MQRKLRKCGTLPIWIWPGGFTGGIQLTAKDIIEAYDNTRCAARFILYDKKKDEVAAVLEAIEIPMLQLLTKSNLP